MEYEHTVFCLEFFSSSYLYELHMDVRISIPWALNFFLCLRVVAGVVCREMAPCPIVHLVCGVAFRPSLADGGGPC